jgi:hypothetical protein
MRARNWAVALVVATASPAVGADLSGGFIPPAGDPFFTASPAVVGHLSLGAGLLQDDGLFFGGNDTVGVFSGVGRANVNLSDTWNVEVETGGQSVFDDGSSFSSIGAAGHLWTRLDRVAVGAFAGVDFPSGATIGTLGIEGETYFGNITLGAEANYSWSDSLGDFWTIGGWADYYLTPDLRIGGVLDYSSGDIPDTLTASVDTEYRFSGTPLSAWGEVNYSNIATGGGDADIWSGLFGLRFFLDGGQTLEEHDRSVPWEGLLSTKIRF